MSACQRYQAVSWRGRLLRGFDQVDPQESERLDISREIGAMLAGKKFYLSRTSASEEFGAGGFLRRSPPGARGADEAR